MKFYNLKNHNEHVSFSQAVKQGLGSQQGLFFPENLPEFTISDINNMMEMDFISRSTRILSAYIGDDIDYNELTKCIKKAFNFPLYVTEVSSNIACLELFYGPTLAFKDFGARFMAEILSYLLSDDQQMTILTATSGDTGAAVAHAFYGMEKIRVVILYPQGKISLFQEKLFCTLGNNIDTIAIDGDFDTCQSLVKQAFENEKLKNIIVLNSANSINVSRLLAQICYYFEAVAQLPQEKRTQLVISVPSGNFGNLTAGLMAKSLGLPVKRFIAATNINDTVPRFLSSGQWHPNPTVTTLSNAMDVSRPNNWPRLEELFFRKAWNLSDLGYGVVSDEVIQYTLRQLSEKQYISEPHSAIAYRLIHDQLQKGEYGLFLGTAHPIKFQNIVEKIIEKPLLLPKKFANYIERKLLSHYMKADFSKLYAFLVK
ncbi:threonine synthase [Candidatus Pantoea carbekii]|uniref:Threonine synthase n=1 Tax=Candidatus Pantoea carbekii TaxID=1235990 RepID=U3U812_9GAMM|nr:threonine synthase [Candidatus Pantoea carbekii]AKC31962.1 threonine synthase ThrC [Candidatus Pantoea carbekii]BAO00479.1 ThrC protein [Candidatus Pantoea carbekii]